MPVCPLWRGSFPQGRPTPSIRELIFHHIRSTRLKHSGFLHNATGASAEFLICLYMPPCFPAAFHRPVCPLVINKIQPKRIILKPRRLPVHFLWRMSGVLSKIRSHMCTISLLVCRIFRNRSLSSFSCVAIIGFLSIKARKYPQSSSSCDLTYIPCFHRRLSSESYKHIINIK